MKLQARRHKTLEQACAAFNESRLATNSTTLKAWLTSHRHLLRFLWASDKAKMLYCNVPKAACTRWKKVFYILNHSNGPFNETMIRNLTDDLYVHSIRDSNLANMSVHDVIHRLRTYKKFIIVRHPFARSLSAYREKIEHKLTNLGRYWMYRVYLYLFRNQPKTPPTQLPYAYQASFPAFLRFTSDPEYGRYNFKGDQHWMPITELCFPCQIKYNYIGKLETMDMDAKFILNKLGAPELQSVVMSADRHDTNSSEFITQYSYFRLLSVDDVKSFEKRYEKDFKYFEYEMNTPLYDEHLRT